MRCPPPFYNRLICRTKPALTFIGVERETFQEMKKLPYYPIPVILLARLAVDKHAQGQGLGNTTLIKSIRHSAAISESIPAYALVIDVKDDDAMSFYKRFDDFRPLANKTCR